MALLGATVTGTALLQLGGWLPVLVAAFVILAILVSFGLGTGLGLPPRVALLIACGNAICGNSAIVALAPLVNADSDEVASAVAYTAVLGVSVVVGLPFLAAAMGLSGPQAGLLSGLTVYAVPHVLAAAAPMGPSAVQTGTIVKLMRVVMIGPASLALVAFRRFQGGPGRKTGSIRGLAPWYILVFLGLAAMRSAGLLPAVWAEAGHHVSEILAVVAMAALGLSSDLKTIARAGPRAGLAVIFSLVFLVLAAFGLLHLEAGFNGPR